MASTKQIDNWRWGPEAGLVEAADGFVFRADALPFIVDLEGGIEAMGSEYVAGHAVFSSDTAAFEYMLSLAKRDLQYRGFRDDRGRCFELKQRANMLLYRRVRECVDPSEYELLRQEWDTANRPKYRELDFSPEQLDAIKRVKEGVSYEDEEERLKSNR